MKSAEMTLVHAMDELINKRLPSNNLIIASVVSVPPALSIKFSEVTIPPEMIYCSNYLLPNYVRDYKLEGTINTIHQDYNSSDMSLEGQGPHKHQLNSSDASGTYETQGKIWWTNTLNVGDEVIVAVVGQFYVVLDRIIKMPNSAAEGGA
jgi:hypothetical protein